MNKTETNIAEDLRQVVGPKNVLTDMEDIYVYSYEQIFGKRQYPELGLIVRINSNEQAHQVIELARKENFTVVRRSVGKVEVFGSADSPIVLIDDVVPPELEVLSIPEENERMAEYTKEIFRAGHGTFRNFALALRTLFLNAPASKCLGCTTCSGYCTVTPSFNGVETWSSKGRALLIRGVSSGELQPSRKLIDILYTCSLCGLCFAECFEDTQVRKAILDARRHLAEKGLAPDLFTMTAKNILETGDVGGTPTAKRLAWMRNSSVRALDKADVLYWVGCVVASRTPHTAKAVVRVLGKADVDFTLLGEKEGCCGYVLLASGLWNEAKDVALHVVERVKESGARVLVTSCAGCYYTFSKLYPEVLNVEMPCEVLHTSQFVYDLIKVRRLELEGLNLKVTYHLSRRRARCCGAGGGLWSFDYRTSVESAYVRLAEDVVPLGVNALATACPTCHVNLRHASVKKSLGIKIYDIMEIVSDSLTIS